MKVVAVVQNKGGVGKTTVARLFAEYLARHRHRVLGIDLDPQCNFSRRFMTMDFDATDPDGIVPPLHPDYQAGEEDDWTGRSSSADIYYTGMVVPYQTALPTFEIIPGEGTKLRSIELVREQDVQQQVHDRLAEFCRVPDVASEYDVAVIDTGPSKGPLTISAVRAATDLIIPTTMEPQPIEGLSGMLQLWRRENRRRTTDGHLRILAIQPNMIRKNVSLHAGLLESLRADSGVAPLLAPHTLYQHVAFAEADHPQAKPKSVFDLPERDAARQEVEAVFAFYRQKLFS